MKTNEITVEKATAADSDHKVDQGPEVITSEDKSTQAVDAKQVKEINGPKGLEPTRYGDWESKGRCYDF